MNSQNRVKFSVYEEFTKAMENASSVLRDKYGDTEEVLEAIEDAAYHYWDAFTARHM